jgi:hypothetical protein
MRKSVSGFSRKSRSKYLESITFMDFGLIQSKVIVILGLSRSLRLAFALYGLYKLCHHFAAPEP